MGGTGTEFKSSEYHVKKVVPDAIACKGLHVFYYTHGLPNQTFLERGKILKFVIIYYYYKKILKYAFHKFFFF